MTLRFGYNTNGFAHHRLSDAIDILADLGYVSVALTLDVHHLDPYADDFQHQAETVRRQLDRRGLRCVIETGARFLLDPFRKHQPTLLDPDADRRAVRLDFLRRCIDLGAILQADAVSFWSGTPESQEPPDILMQRLADGCKRLADAAAAKGVRLAFEPEPGMLIDTMPRYRELSERVDHAAFGLTLDVGHLHCTGETPIAEHIHVWRDRLRNVHIEDMRPGVHDHLMFGEGDMDFPPILRALEDIGYAGGVHVELSRHSHDAVRIARQAIDFLRAT
ncbi:MAG: sugar phosphate isomerase/epimerase [Gemmataceae bacterium]|nr:sugar phosphate isomerase/epimerase [Gemmataceae bacterium]